MQRPHITTGKKIYVSKHIWKEIWCMMDPDDNASTCMKLQYYILLFSTYFHTFFSHSSAYIYYYIYTILFSNATSQFSFYKYSIFCGTTTNTTWPQCAGATAANGRLRDCSGMTAATMTCGLRSGQDSAPAARQRCSSSRAT